SGGSPRLRRPAPRRRRTGHPDPLRRRPGSRPPLGEGATGLADLVPVDGLVAPLQGGLRPLPGEHDGVRRTGLAHGVADRLAPVPDRDEVGAARLPGAALHLAQDLLQRGVAVVLLGEDGDVGQPGGDLAERCPLRGVTRTVSRAFSRLGGVWAKSTMTRGSPSSRSTISIRPATPPKVARPATRAASGTPAECAPAIAASALATLKRPIIGSTAAASPSGLWRSE